MPGAKKIQKWMEAANNYYSFALLAYAGVLFAAGHQHVFMWAFIVLTPAVAAWLGYGYRGRLERRTQRYGFRTLSSVVSYEVGANHRYVLHYATTIRAATDHLMIYPMAYQWTGKGQEFLPKIESGQELLGSVRAKTASVEPYEASTVSTEGDWRYWFIAINPPVHSGDVVDIKYSQKFYDAQGAAKPYFYHFVRTPMERLELNVRFPSSAKPVTVAGSYIKPSDPNRPYAVAGVHYDIDKHWATWVIERPKVGYCYRIQWR